jgi:glutamate-1-semialdehyde 2,1-aminomutase
VNLSVSKQVFEASQKVIPGGVNSPVRAFGSVGGIPPVISSAKGCRVIDEDGNEYVDYVGSWGPMILGHAHPSILKAAQAAMNRGSSFGAPTRLELELAELVVARVPGLEMVRMVNSGTEACMSALRLARGFTGRDRIVKFEGHYHGHADFLLVKAGSGVATLGIPGSPGIPAGAAQDTLTLPWNDVAALEELFQEHPDQIAAVIFEPVPGNMGVVPAVEGFLETLRELTREHGALLICDEVMTGFRLAPGGAQERLGIEPDLSTFGKVIGGGFPVGAYGGRAEIMRKLAPEGPVYQAGTLSGNPVAMAAGLAALEELGKDGVYQQLEEKSSYLVDGLQKVVQELEVPVSFHRVGSMWTTFFTASPPVDYLGAQQANQEAFKKYFHAMLERGIYLAPSGFEAGFVSLAHQQEDLDKTIAAHGESLKVAFHG